MSDILQKQVLILNNNGTPLSWWPLSTNTVKRVIKALLKDKLTVLDEYPDKLHLSGTTMQLPKVVLLKKFIQPTYKPKFSRNTIYIRDMYTCQYCHRQFKPSELTFDHIIPISKFKDKSQATTWTNIVTACKCCNAKKADTLLQNTNMKLDKMPRIPTNKELLMNVIKLKDQGYTVGGIDKLLDWNSWLGI